MLSASDAATLAAVDDLRARSHPPGQARTRSPSRWRMPALDATAGQYRMAPSDLSKRTHDRIASIHLFRPMRHDQAAISVPNVFFSGCESRLDRPAHRRFFHTSGLDGARVARSARLWACIWTPVTPRGSTGAKPPAATARSIEPYRRAKSESTDVAPPVERLIDALCRFADGEPG